ncbi:MAG: phosphate acyltransferase PlsX [Clostridia bacterium]|nr:phosphate acyltransferase PlsX [Clostridia bacterium]
MRIIVDVMGGDNAPEELVKGAVSAAGIYEADYILVGDKEAIEKTAEENSLDISGFEIVDAKGVVSMTDDPISVVRKKADSSMVVGLKMLAEDKGDAFVSTGNTGALFTASTLIVRKLKGIKRAGIGAVLPLENPVLLLDSGANVTVTPEYLEDFAMMGSAYMKKAFGIEEPRVGLLNNGSEECKGTELQTEAYKLLKANRNINFVGNIEGNRVTRNECDVLVADGFTGNILLKSIEGVGKLMLGSMKGLFYKDIKTKLAGLMVKKYVGEMKRKFDPAEHGGAPFLGFRKPVIKAHGNSKAKAFENAIRQAHAYAVSGVIDDIAAAALDMREKRKSESSQNEEMRGENENG